MLDFREKSKLFLYVSTKSDKQRSPPIIEKIKNKKIGESYPILSNNISITKGDRNPLMRDTALIEELPTVLILVG